MQRQYPAAEYTQTEGQPLPPARLAAIWRSLPEAERFPFLLSLDEELGDQMLAEIAKREARQACRTIGRNEHA